MLLEMHGAPLLSTTLIDPTEGEALNDPEQIRRRFEKLLDAVVGAGPCPDQPTTVVDLVPMGLGGDAVLVRQGRGDASIFGL
jgi:tRNA A37 threonylcarbamoyladenosine synthetase subunit TsaC/SUA5/YrdC